MLISKEMEGVGTLRISRVDHDFVYCLKDSCDLLKLKLGNRIRSELISEEVYLLPIHEGTRNKSVLFIGLKYLNRLFNLAQDQSRSTLVAEWLTKDVFPFFVRGDEYTLEKLEDPSMRMSLLSDYEQAKFKIAQMEAKQKDNKPYLDSMVEIFGRKNAVSLNVYYDQIFNRGFPKGRFFAMLRSFGILNEENQVTQEYLDNVRFKKITTISTVCDKKITTEVVFVTKSGITLIEQLLNSFEGDSHFNERNKG
ncbi:MAG: hypothetical protein MJ248_06900 [Bacilli bacterium]|nr:hypothetical protein [Bacilli bacterium]